MIMAVSALCAFSLAWVAVLYNQLDREKAKHRECHEKTLALLVKVNRGRDKATALREAAVNYDLAATQGDLRRLAREKFQPEGPSVPALWLEEEAQKIDAQDSEGFTSLEDEQV